MPFPRALAWPPLREAGLAGDGPAVTVLVSSITRIAAVVRVAGLSYLVLQVIVWHSFYLAHPAFLWAPAAVAGWGTLATWYLLRRGPRRWPAIAVDSAVCAALAVAAAGCVPDAVRDQPGSWLFIALTSQLVAPAWLAPAAASAPLVALTATGYAAGELLVPGARPGGPATTVVLFLAVLVLHWTGRTMLLRRASQADAGLAAAEAQAREQYVILSRNLERREQDRLLHDTVLNTLTAIARTGAAGRVAARCEHDLAELGGALREPADPAPARPVSWAALLGRLGAATRELQARGLVTHLAPLPPPGRPGPARQVPGPVADALVQAAREALANVAAHAGTGEAWVTARPAPAADADDPGPAGPAGIELTIRDAGRGFDPSRVGPDRLGLRRSISERVADCGGAVSVRSVPGQGTEVRLRWPAGDARQPGAGLAAVGRPGQPLEVPSC